MLNEILEKATVGVLVIGVLCVGASSQTDSLSRRGYPPKELHIGNTVAFGPDFDVDGQGFYEEDVSLITADGYQLIQSTVALCGGRHRKNDGAAETIPKIGTSR